MRLDTLDKIEQCDLLSITQVMYESSPAGYVLADLGIDRLIRRGTRRVRITVSSFDRGNVDLLALLLLCYFALALVIFPSCI